MAEEEIPLSEREFPADQYVQGSLTQTKIDHWMKIKTASFQKLPLIGEICPDGPIYTLDCQETTLHQHLQQIQKPILISFGELLEVVKEFDSKIHFMIVYIDEAHAQDEWRMYTDVCFNSPKTLQDRVDLAKQYISLFKLENFTVFVDNMKNSLNHFFNAWPERLFVIDSKLQMIFIGEPGPNGYRPSDVKMFLFKYFSQ